MSHRLILGAALAALIGGALPSPVAAASANTAITAAGMPAAMAVARFHDARGALWLGQPEAADTLIAALRDASVDGFDRGPDLAVAIERALGAARSGDAAAATEAERLMSGALVGYAQAMRWPGSARMIFADPALAPQVPTADIILRDAAAAPDLAAFVRGIVEVNPIHAALRAAAIRDARLLGTPSRALQSSMERARLLPTDGRFVLVDIASQQLMMIDEGKVVDTMKVVVGKPEMKTPLMAGTLRQMTLNPYWNVPVDLVAKNIAPNVVRNGTAWLAAKKYEVLSGWDADARVIDPATVDWQAVADGRLEARVRQLPGAGNMMGAMKFEFPNTLGIYLHDTPNRTLFSEAERTYSSGCVRLEDAARLGHWLMGREPVAASAQPELQVPLAKGVPVYLTYLTVRPRDDGTLAYAPDIYGLDSAPGGARLATAR